MTAIIKDWLEVALKCLNVRTLKCLNRGLFRITENCLVEVLFCKTTDDELDKMAKELILQTLESLKESLHLVYADSGGE